VHCAGLVGLTGVEIASALAISQQAVSRMQLKHALDEVQLVAMRVMQRFATAANDVIPQAA
jgi:hypothetical protein